MPQPELSTLPDIDYYGSWFSPCAIIHVHPPRDPDSVFRAYVDVDGHPVCAPIPTCFIPWYAEYTDEPVSDQAKRCASAFRAFVEHMAVGLQASMREYARQEEAEKSNGIRRMLDTAPATLPRRR